MSFKKIVLPFIILSSLLGQVIGDDYSKEVPWLFNPFAKENPLLFASSRMGQVYMPGAGVSVGRPTFMLLSGLMGSSKGLAMEGLASTYIAHVSWRLGCDQGHLMANELYNDSYKRFDDYFLGTLQDTRNSKLQSIARGSDFNPHPILAKNNNQNITPLALALFGMGQVVGQNVVGPMIGKALGKLKFMNKPMGPWMSKVSMDVYGWPSDYTFLRKDAVSKLSGILVGTYLGWSLNDFGWQLANWRKFSLDAFDHYFPETGLLGDFGTIEGGWRILGFTLGGMYGHNIGAAAMEGALRTFAKPGGIFLTDQLAVSSVKGMPKPYNMKWTGTALTHGSAIAGNLLLGLTMTAYFPHLYRKLFNHYERPKTFVPDVSFEDMNSDEQKEHMKRLVARNLSTSFDQLVDSIYSTVPTANFDFDQSIFGLSSNDQTVLRQVFDEQSKEEVTNYVEAQHNEETTKEQFRAQMAEYEGLFARFVDSVSTQIENQVLALTKNLEVIQDLEFLREYLKVELKGIVPQGMDAERVARVVDSVVTDPEQLENYKKRFLNLYVHLYPTMFKYNLMKQYQDMSQDDNYLENLMMWKRDFVIRELKRIEGTHPRTYERLTREFDEAQQSLLSDDPNYYTPEVLQHYNTVLDGVMVEIDRL